MAKKITDNLVKFTVSFFGIGYIPFMPGTFGSLAGLVIYCLLRNNPVVFYAILFFFALTGFIISGKAEAVFGKKDAKPIVIDEVVGMMTAFVFIPFGLFDLSAVVMFLLFRFFDVIKPYPIKRLEKLPSGWGVMLDDIAAGIYAGLIFQAAFGLFKFALDKTV